MSDLTILQISKDTLESFQKRKLQYQADKSKKITNDEFLQELLK